MGPSSFRSKTKKKIAGNFLWYIIYVKATAGEDDASHFKTLWLNKPAVSLAMRKI